MTAVPPVISTNQPINGAWVDLEPLPQNVKVGRRFARRALSDHDEDHVDMVELVVSELLTNAYRAIQENRQLLDNPVIGLGVRRCDRYDHLYVQDPIPVTPRARTADDDDEDGRGLPIIETYAALLWADVRACDKTMHAVMTHPGEVLSEDDIQGLVSGLRARTAAVKAAAGNITGRRCPRTPRPTPTPTEEVPTPSPTSSTPPAGEAPVPTPVPSDLPVTG